MTEPIRLQLRGRIELIGVNPFVRVRAEQARRLREGWKRPLPVRVQINGAPDPPWPVSMMPIGDGDFYLYLSGIVRKASNTKVGDVVEVSLEFDSGYKAGPTHPIPPSFARGLEESPRAEAAWRNLPPSLQKEMLRYLANLRSSEARRRNVDRALRVLGGSRERFLGRAWNEPKRTARTRSLRRL